MKFVWALFFIGAGDIQPIDTEHRFKSSKECYDAHILVGRQIVDAIYNYQIWNDKGEFTPQARRNTEEQNNGLLKMAYYESEKYICIVKK